MTGLVGEEKETGLVGMLLDFERELAAGDAEAYRRRLSEDAIVIVPGQSLDKQATVAAIEASAGWDGFRVEDCRLLDFSGNTALITYRFQGRRGEFNYEALLSSAYVKDADGSWRLTFHQQTPL